MSINVKGRNEGTQSSIADRHRLIAEKLCKILNESSGNKFVIEKGENHLTCVNVSRLYREKHKESFFRYPVKSPDGRELGQMYTEGDLYDIYIDGRRVIKWPDDWIDPYPISVETVTISRDQIEIEIDSFDLHFLCKYYYALWPLILLFSNEDSITVMLSKREDRMKAARIMPAVIKDIEVFLKSLQSSLERWSIGQQEVKYNFSILGASIKFDTVGMNDEHIINEVIKRTDALTEHLKRMKSEWFPSEERRNYYEETKLFRDDPFRERIWSRVICKWPLKRDEEFNRKYEDVMRDELIESLSEPRHKVYNLDGYKLRLVNYRLVPEKVRTKVVENGKVVEHEVLKEKIEDGTIIVDKRSRLYKFPLEKIEFLKEDFPEMFK